ncbi:acyltransferase domain-containing protein, partial [Streptomyces sp. NPDC055005]
RRDRVDQVEVHSALAAYVNATSGDLDWSGVHVGKGQRTITLPTYPFNRQELIVPAAGRSATATSTVSHPLFDRHYEHRSEGQ